MTHHDRWNQRIFAVQVQHFFVLDVLFHVGLDEADFSLIKHQRSSEVVAPCPTARRSGKVGTKSSGKKVKTLQDSQREQHIQSRPPLASVNTRRGTRRLIVDKQQQQQQQRRAHWYIASSTVVRFSRSRSSSTSYKRWRTKPSLRTSRRPSRSRRDAACASPR